MRSLAIRDMQLLQELPEELLQHIERHLTPRPRSSGQLLFLKGDPERFIAFVQRGCVYHMLDEPNGREVIMDHTMAGEMLGESVLLHPQRHAYTGQLSRDCQLALLHQRHFGPLQDNHEFMSRLQRQLCQRLRHMSDFVESACLHRLETRLARHLLSGMPDDDAPEVALPANQSILAAMINASRPRLSLLLQRWQREGLIQPHPRKLKIVNPERLRLIAAAEGT